MRGFSRGLHVADSGVSALGCVTWWRSYVSSVECMSFPGDEMGALSKKKVCPLQTLGMAETVPRDFFRDF